MDRTALDDGVRRITGGGLKANQILSARRSGDMKEMRHRAMVAVETAVAAITRMAGAGTLTAVLYVSDGYAAEETLDPTRVIQAALDAQVPVHVFSMRNIAVADPPVVNQAEWDAYVSDSAESLRRLSTATGGVAFVGTNDLSAVLSSLR